MGSAGEPWAASAGAPTSVVSVLHRLRGQLTFPSDRELVEQMARDAEAAAGYLASAAR
jgi:FAD synthase